VGSQALLGVDVGFSERRKTTGLAWFSDSGVQVTVSGSSWSERKHDLPVGSTFRLAALDAPIVPTSDAGHRRGCEYIFYGGAFARRCRPGLSHHGRGLRLRHAGTQSAYEFANILSAGPLPYGPHVLAGIPIVEAFPNTFMGVLLPEDSFLSWSKFLHLPKSDWLYEQLVELKIIRKLLDRLMLRERSITNVFEQTTNHDERAALICLLTAMFAANGNAVIVGDNGGGWFWLPPIELWASWARAGLELELSRNQKRKFPSTAKCGGDRSRLMKKIAPTPFARRNLDNQLASLKGDPKDWRSDHLRCAFDIVAKRTDCEAAKKIVIQAVRAADRAVKEAARGGLGAARKSALNDFSANCRALVGLTNPRLLKEIRVALDETARTQLLPEPIDLETMQAFFSACRDVAERWPENEKAHSILRHLVATKKDVTHGADLPLEYRIPKIALDYEALPAAARRGCESALARVISEKAERLTAQEIFESLRCASHAFGITAALETQPNIIEQYLATGRPLERSGA
jgi:hypothetical protein